MIRFKANPGLPPMTLPLLGLNTAVSASFLVDVVALVVEFDVVVVFEDTEEFEDVVEFSDKNLGEPLSIRVIFVVSTI